MDNCSRNCIKTVLIFLLLITVKTPEHRTKKPLGKSISTENNDETRSNSSSTASNSKTPRKTPAQVKAESAARKAKVNKQLKLCVLT